MRNILTKTICLCAMAGIWTCVTGCRTEDNGMAQSTAVIVAAQASVAAPAPATAPRIIRIKAGLASPFTDSRGNVWEAEQGFSGGDVNERDAGTAIANTQDAGLFLSEQTVPVEVTDGTFEITFTSNVENPQINAIELLPQM